MLGYLLYGCVSPLEVDFFQERPWVPLPPEIAVWYAETEACVDSLGLPNRRDFHQAQWFLADSINSDDGRSFGAATILPGNHISVTTPRKTNKYTIRHEAAHHITQLKSEIHTDAVGFGALCDGWPP